MKNIILISGRLDKKVFENLKREILLADKSKKITFIINSGGGEIEPNLEFSDWFAEIKSQLFQTEVKIHIACSAAAGFVRFSFDFFNIYTTSYTSLITTLVRALFSFSLPCIAALLFLDSSQSLFFCIYFIDDTSCFCFSV